jgi:hypothetical protein
MSIVTLKSLEKTRPKALFDHFERIVEIFRKTAASPYRNERIRAKVEEEEFLCLGVEPLKAKFESFNY